MGLTTFETRLFEWYKQHGRHHLPWRQKNITPYEVWVSETMLQQTQVSRVIDYYVRFLKKFPTIQRLAKASWEEFYPFYAGLGYYNRGRHMLECAQIVVSRHKGKFPVNKKELMLLPGIGEYTASAILSFGYNKNELAVDTNVQKVLGRVFYGSRGAHIDWGHFRQELKTNKRELNAALMDFSYLICTKVPRCEFCPLKNICIYYATHGQKEEKALVKKEPFPLQEASVRVFLHKDHKEYYSSKKNKFVPFTLQKKYNTREKIKEYFRKKYGLELAVRPPYKKIFIADKPVLLINAQILMGVHHFSVFTKKDLPREQK